MRIMFMPDRGSYKESLAEAIEFTTVEGMLYYICELYHGAFESTNLSIAYRGYDYRVHCGYFNILTTRYFNDDYLELYGAPQCMGSCTFKYED